MHLIIFKAKYSVRAPYEETMKSASHITTCLALFEIVKLSSILIKLRSLPQEVRTLYRCLSYRERILIRVSFSYSPIHLLYMQ